MHCPLKMNGDDVLIAIAIEGSISHQLTSKNLWATVLAEGISSLSKAT